MQSGGVADRDKHLAEKLRSELPGIQVWAVLGCLEWQKSGLQTPDEVKQATREYQTDMDVIQAFLDDRCFIKVESTDVKTIWANCMRRTQVGVPGTEKHL